ncbi:MAG: hypothetical protein JSV92_04490 [archaeon]|nr:MAG: hypothetical protein JSV92_04490 [archaeon]
MPVDNSSYELSYVLNVLNDRINRQGEVISGIYDILETQEKAKRKEREDLKKFVEGEYGHLYHLIENVNIWNERVHGEPKRTDVTSIPIACRLVGNEDIFSVITDAGAAFPMGLYAGYSDAGLKDYKPLSETNLYIPIAQLHYGPAADLTESALYDQDMIRGTGNEIGEYGDNLPGYDIRRDVNLDENGNLNFSFNLNERDFRDSDDSDSIA